MVGVGTRLQGLLDDVLGLSSALDEQVWNVLVAGHPGEEAGSSRQGVAPTLPVRANAVGKKVEVHAPRPLFRALSKQRDLSTVEHILAETMDAVVVCLASPAAYAQLGAFANHHALAGRVYVVSEVRHRSDPVLRTLLRHVAGRQSPRRVVWVQEDAEGTSRAEAFEKACWQLLESLSDTPRVRSVTRPLTERPYDLIGLQRFVLAAAYLLEAVREESLQSFLSERVSLPPAYLAMLFQAAKDHLFLRGYIRRGEDQALRVSERGVDYIQALVEDLPFARKRLDFLRFAGMNRIG
jgi:hypothetical protein